jgi:alanyl aminopeptidase
MDPDAMVANDAAAWAGLSPEDIPGVEANGQLPALATPTRYDLSLEIDPSQPRYSGVQTITMRVPHATRTLVMHGRGLTIRTAAVLDASGRPTQYGDWRFRQATGGRGEPEELLLVFANALEGDAVRLQITFENSFNASLRALYRVHVADRWYAYTQFEPNDARRAFPCFDEPAAKVPWGVTLTVPTDNIPVANMPEAERTTLADHRVRVRFADTPPTPSYLVAVAVGPFDVVEHSPVELHSGGESKTVPLRGIATHGQGPMTREALDIAAAHLQILSEYFDRNYAYPKLDLIGVPEFGAGAMENPGLVTFREEMLLLNPDPARVSVNSRRGIASIIAHELAHQWFGNLVTMRWWDDLWLNEGFATWMGARVLDTWRPAMNSRVESIRSRAWAMDEDSLPTARIVRQPVRSTSEAEEAFDGITYVKGASVLRMLESYLGEDVFRTGVRAYVRSHAWSNATAQDFLGALQQAQPAGPNATDLSQVAASFLDRRGVPLVSISAQCARGTAPSLQITQQEYRVLGSPMPGANNTQAGAQPMPPPPVWRIPLCIRYGQGAASARTCSVVTERQSTASLAATASTTASCPAWVHPNDAEAGYFRYALTPPVRALFEPARWQTLDRITRIGLVDGLWAQVRAGALPIDQYLTLVYQVRSDRDRLVLESISSGLGQLIAHHAEGAVRDRLRAFTTRIFAPVLRELTWAPRPTDDDDKNLLRRSVISILGSAALDPETLTEVETRATALLANNSAIPADLATLLLPIASLRADRTRLDALIARLQRTDLTPQERSSTQSALVSFRDPAVLRLGLDTLLTNAVRQQDVGRLIYSSGSHPDRRATVHSWVREHYDAIAAKLTEEQAVTLSGLVGDTCDATSRDAMIAFFQPRAARAERAERGINEGRDSSQQCEALRTAIAPALTRWTAPR